MNQVTHSVKVTSQALTITHYHLFLGLLYRNSNRNLGISKAKRTGTPAYSRAQRRKRVFQRVVHPIHPIRHPRAFHSKLKSLLAPPQEFLPRISDPLRSSQRPKRYPQQQLPLPSLTPWQPD